MSAESETELLANYIMANIPGEPSQSDGAGGTAVRILEAYRAAFRQIVNDPSNARAIASSVLNGSISKPQSGGDLLY